MDIQSKLLDKEYIATRLRDLPQIRKNEIKFEIKESDRIMSKTIYVEFYGFNNGKWFKHQTVRISDHSIKNCPHIEFIIQPYEYLTKKKKEQFIRTLENAIKASLKRNFYIELNNISRRLDNEQGTDI